MLAASPFNNQYIIVRDTMRKDKKKSKKADSNKNEIVDGNSSFLARYNAETLSQLDPEVFLRHSEIADTYHVRLDFLRDFKNCLRLLSKEDHCDYIEELERDISRMNIAKLAHRNFHQACWQQSSKKDMAHELQAETVTP